MYNLIRPERTEIRVEFIPHMAVPERTGYTGDERTHRTCIWSSGWAGYTYGFGIRN